MVRRLAELSRNRKQGSERGRHAGENPYIPVETLLDNASNIIENAVLFDISVSLPTSNRKLENTSFMHTYYSAVTDGNNIWLVRLFVEEAIPQKGGEPFTRGYELKEIEKIGEIAEGVLLSNESLTQAKSPITLNSISDLFKIVKQFDKNFNPLPVSRELLNEDGTPKVVYHGTDKGGFYTFDPEMSDDKISLFFSDNIVKGTSSPSTPT